MLDAVAACFVEWVSGGYVLFYFFFGVVAHFACGYEVVDDCGWVVAGWDDGYCCYYLVVSLF